MLTRREALRTLAGGMVAGAVAGGAVVLVTPSSAETPDEKTEELQARFMEKFRRLDEANQRAIVACLAWDVEGTDPTEEVYAALGRERGDAMLAFFALKARRRLPNG